MQLDAQACYRAVRARDVRFDGRFFTCVKTTGIYCRPICPAKAAKFQNVLFLPSAAAAQAAGFRPCLRCRPELSPDVAAWRGTENTVARALQLIAEGGLDGEADVEGLAERLGVGERQLRRLFTRHLGASPVAVAQTRRLLFAKQLVQETGLSMAEVALASGFGSIRRFNAVFRALYSRAPSAFRHGKGTASSDIVLRLGYRPPYDWDAMLGFLAARAVPGVERVVGGAYRRTLEVDGGVSGTLEVRPCRDALVARFRIPSMQALPALVAKLRRVFDLDADVQTIGAHLARDPALGPLVARRPGLRSPGGWDGFEQAVRAILGQQVSVVAARKLAGALVAIAGGPVPAGRLDYPGLDHLFPTPARLLAADLSRLPMPEARKEALRWVAVAALRDPELFRVGVGSDTAVAKLRALRGFGDWTAQYVALRALGEADAFPAGDVALQRAARKLIGRPTKLGAPELLARADPWRPWRGYAAQHLWTADALMEV
jgi:AraC family transcriptional regulator, regulatory protein of adaptative response / DNA-3-methyladenine glycosylase II